MCTRVLYIILVCSTKHAWIVLHVVLFPSCRTKPPEHSILWIGRFILTVSGTFATTTRKNHCLDMASNYAVSELILTEGVLLFIDVHCLTILL